MKKIFALLVLFSTKIVFAEQGTGILGGNNMSVEDLRSGDIHLDDIPSMIQYAIDFLMGIAGTISVIVIIIGAYQHAFGSLSQNKSKGKETIFMGLLGFAVASLSWFIIKFILDNF